MCLNYCILALCHSRIRASILVFYKIALALSLVVNLLIILFWKEVGFAFIFHRSLYFLLTISFIEFGFQLLYPLHTIYVMMLLILTICCALTVTRLLHGVLER